MSNRRFLSSGGAPYLGFASTAISTLPGGGLTWLAVTARIDRLPTQRSSPDELHALVSLVDVSGGTVLELGVTPSGRWKCACWNGDVSQTGPGVISDTTRWYSVFSNYDFLGGEFVLLGDVAADVPATLGQPLLTQSGLPAQLLLFNGAGGLTNMAASVQRAGLTFQAGGDRSYSYRFTEKQGGVLTPTRDTGNLFTEWRDGTPLVVDDPAAFIQLPDSGIATATVWPGTVQWGPPPSTPPHYEWGFSTDYTRVPKPTTAYTRVQT